MTFSQYLNAVRLEHAIELLKNNTEHLAITEIAAKCGFDTIRHFNRVFKDITGMSPRQMPSDYVRCAANPHYLRCIQSDITTELL